MSQSKGPPFPAPHFLAVFLCGVIVGLTPSLPVGPVRAAESTETQFLEGLRQRRLFRLAETLCRQRLAETQLSAASRVTWTTELIRCCVEQALNAAPAARAPLWQAARETAAEFLRAQPPHPRAELVRAQDALTLVARGELARQEAEVQPEPAPALEAARDTLREAARLLEPLDSELAREIPARRRSARPPELTADELLALQQTVRFQLARNFRNQALCYPPNSADRTAAFTRAVDHLTRALTQAAEADPQTDQIRLALAACQRLLGEFTAAERTLEQLPQRPLDPAVRRPALAELVRLRIAQGRPREALAVLENEPAGGEASAEWDYAHLEILVALWQAAAAAQDQPQADQWRAQALARVKDIEQAHGPYWGRRADLLLVNSVGSSAGSGDAEVLARTADNLYRQGRMEDALAAYDRAAAAARAAADAFPLRYKAALVEHSRQRHLAAAVRLRRLGCDLASHANARDAHLLAAWNVAQAAARDTHLIDRYCEILEEHIRLWPQGPTTSTAQLWLGRVRESQQDWPAAVAALAAIPRDHAALADATRAAARCSQEALRRAQSVNELTDAQVQAAARLFISRVAPLQADPRAGWTEVDRFCAETAARLVLQFAPSHAAEVESVLRAALDGTPPPAAQGKAAAEALLVLTLAAQSTRREEAQRLLTGWDGESAAPLLEVLDGLTRMTPNAPPARKRELATLQLAVLERLSARMARLTPAQQQVLRRVRAEALTVAGRRREAAAAYAELAREQPDDANVQLAYAELLLAGDDAAAWRAALDQWRIIGNRAAPHSDLWYRAKYSVAAALYKLGERQEAATRIRYLQSLPPGLDQSPWKPKFLELLRQCEGR